MAASLVLMLSNTSLAAAEPLPFLELSYQQAPTLQMPPQLAPWWHTSVAEASSWFQQTVKADIHVEEFLQHLQSVHLVGAGLADGAMLRPSVSCTWQGDAVPPALAALLASWPGQLLSGSGARHSLRGPGFAAELALPQTSPGWHLTIHGQGLARDLQGSSIWTHVGLPREQIELLSAAIARWSLQCAIEPDGHGWVDTGLPQRWFTALDTAALRHIPDHTLMAAAVAIDGSALAQALEHSIGKELPYEGFLGIPSGITLLDLAHACTGTWVICSFDDGSWLLRTPRSTDMDTLVQRIFQENQFPLPDDEGCTHVQNVYCAKHPQEWLWAEGSDTIRSWDAPTATASALARQVPAAADSMWAAALAASYPYWFDSVSGPSEVIQCALPSSLRTPPIVLEFAPPSPDSHGKGWADFIDSLGKLPDVHLQGRAGGSTLVIDVAPGGMPWVLPGMAVRWFADYVQDRVGLTKLVKTITRLHAQGESAIPSQGHATLTIQQVRQRTAGELLVSRLVNNRGLLRLTSWRRFLAFGAAAMDDDRCRQEAAAAAGVLELSAEIDDPGFPSASQITRMGAGDAADESIIYAKQASATQCLCNAGFALIANGDRRGLVLLNRAQRFARRPANAQEASLAWNIAVNRDMGYLAAELQQLLPTDELTAWLHQDDQISLSYWTGERSLICGTLARYLLQGTTVLDPLYAPWLGDLHLAQVHEQWAAAAGDLATCMLAMQSCESDSFHIAPELGAVTSEVGVAIAGSIIQKQLSVQIAVAQRQFMRISGTIAALAVQGKVPKTQGELEHAIGPLSLSWGATTRPLIFEAIGSRGFHLFLDAKPGPPAQWSQRAWEFMTVKPPANAPATYIRHRGFNLRVDPTAARTPLEGVDVDPGQRP